jgi:hypothetical protein
LPFCIYYDIISGMTGTDETNESQASILCRSCGLCCTGHLFIWAKLRPAELDPAEALGMEVFRSDPTQRGFSLPCPLWHGQCTIYTSANYPRVCRAYKCKLLKEVLGESITLSKALSIIEQVKEMIRELELLLPVSSESNFRKRLVTHLEHLKASAGQGIPELEFQLKVESLLTFYEEHFGVNDLIDRPAEE